MPESERAAPSAAAVRPPAASLFARGAAAAVSAAVSASLITVLAAVVASIVVLSLVAWLLFTESGNRQILERLPYVTVTGTQGTVWGDFRAERVTVALPNRWQIVIESPRWRGLRIEDFDWPTRRPHIRAEELVSRQVRVIPPSPRDPKPVEPPADLVMPFALLIGEVRVAEVQAPGLAAPLEDVRTGFELGAGPGVLHRLSRASLAWDRLRFNGDLIVGADAPVSVDLKLATRQREPGEALAEAWAADLHATGALTALDVEATVTARAQSLDLRSHVAPFAAQPLDRLDATAKNFDVQALFRAAPRTALSGTLHARLAEDTTVPPARAGRGSSMPSAAASAPSPSSAASAPPTRTLPIVLEADLRNARAATWPDGGLPVRSLVLSARGDALDPRSGRAERLQAELGTASQPGGRLQGSLRWLHAPGTPTSRGPAHAHLQLVADATLDALRPQHIDPRAPALRLSGPLAFDVTVPLAGNPAPLQGKLSGHWQGRLESRSELPEADVAFDLSGQLHDLTIHALAARAGEARLDWAGRLARSGAGDDAPLQVTGEGRLQAFDPRVWWTTAPDAPWARAAQRYGARATIDLTLPVTAGAWARPGQALAALLGKADVQIDEASLAGLGATGQVQITAPAGQAVTIGARLNVATGQIELQGQLDRSTVADAALDQGTLRWIVPDAATLTPWLALAGVDGIDGDGRGEITWQGRGERLTAHGELSAGRLRARGVEVRELQATLQGGMAADAPLSVKASAARVDLGDDQPHVETLGVAIRGTRLEHRIELAGDYDARALKTSGAGGVKATGTDRSGSATGIRNAQGAAQLKVGRLRMQADGGVQARPDLPTGQGWQWRGAIDTLELGPQDTTEARWLRLLGALPLRVAVGGAPPEIEAGPGRLAADAATLRLTRIRFEGAPSAGAPPFFALNVQLEPLAVAPLLERAQPGFGWQGDLTVDGRVDLAVGPDGLQGDLHFGRAGGDLVLNEPDNPSGPMPLGLSALAIDFSARGGRWRLTQALSGTQLGSLRGEQTVTTPARALWPPDDSPVQGHVDLDGLNLASAAGRWMPPGWRVAGDISTRARMAGTFSAPEFTGELSGRNLALRNTAQGIDWRGAEFALSMRGAEARIERFEVQGGDGTAVISGKASFGAEPRAELQLKASRFAALQRVDRRVVASGEVEATLTTTRLVLRGQLKADEGLIDISQSDAPSLGEDVVVRRADAAAEEESEGADSGARSNRTQVIDLRLDLGDRFFLRGRGVDTRLAGQARLTSAAGRLQLHGTIEAQDGTYAAYGQKLTIDRGLFVFTGPLENPRLDVEATRSNLDIRVGVAITGTAINPRVRLFSEPDMADTDKLSWLILGRAPDGLARTDLALLQRAAYALVSGESESVDLVKAVGLDELSVRQGDGEVRETVVTLGKQLSRRWYVGYERSLNATTGTWQLIYRAAQRFTLRAQSGVENSLDLIWTWLWD